MAGSPCLTVVPIRTPDYFSTCSTPPQRHSLCVTPTTVLLALLYTSLMDSSIWLSRSLIFSSSSSILLRIWILSSSIRLTSFFSCVSSSVVCWTHENVNKYADTQHCSIFNIIYELYYYSLYMIHNLYDNIYDHYIWLLLSALLWSVKPILICILNAWKLKYKNKIKNKLNLYKYMLIKIT